MSLNQTINQIKQVKIQGASNICRAGILAWQDYLLKSKIKNIKKYLQEAKNIGARLALARPNEPLTVNAFKYLNTKLDNVGTRRGAFSLGIPSLKKSIKQYVQDFSTLLHDNGQKIANHGSKLIKNKENIFIHCHSRTVENILIKAKQDNKKFHIYNDETRPLLQGRITSKELSKYNIPNTMVVDSAAPFLVSDISGDDIKINKVMIGFDVILPDGGAFNKIGSFGIALAAYTSGIPLYLCGSVLKITQDKKTKIEIRDENEVWKDKPKNLKIINYAFGHIPAKFITGYITEHGIIKPRNILKYYKK